MGEEGGKKVEGGRAGGKEEGEREEGGREQVREGGRDGGRDGGREGREGFSPTAVIILHHLFETLQMSKVVVKQ